MAVDPARAEETIAWLAKADEDLRAARVLIDVREPLFETAILHCRQATEEARESAWIPTTISWNRESSTPSSMAWGR